MTGVVLRKIEKRKGLDKKIRLIADAIRKKYMTLKLGSAASEENTRKLFKPVSEPLEKIVSSIKEEQPTSSTTHYETVFIKKQPKGHKFTPKRHKFTPKSSPAQPKRKDEEEMSVFDSDDDTTPEQLDDDFENEEFLNQYPPLVRSYIRLIMKSTDKFDLTFGPRPDWAADKWYLGNQPLIFQHDNSIQIANRVFLGTEGVYELLFMNKPDESKIKSQDYGIYKDILNFTNVHRVNFEKEGRVRSSASYKYTKVIMPLVKSTRSRSASTPGRSMPYPHAHPLLKKKTPHKGEGMILGEYKITSDKPVEYVYWNDINELVDRLRLLYASAKAGNNAHTNEVASILEELKEEGIIV